MRASEFLDEGKETRWRANAHARMMKPITDREKMFPKKKVPKPTDTTTTKPEPIKKKKTEDLEDFMSGENKPRTELDDAVDEIAEILDTGVGPHDALTQYYAQHPEMQEQHKEILSYFKNSYEASLAQYAQNVELDKDWNPND